MIPMKISELQISGDNIRIDQTGVDESSLSQSFLHAGVVNDIIVDQDRKVIIGGRRSKGLLLNMKTGKISDQTIIVKQPNYDYFREKLKGIVPEENVQEYINKLLSLTEEIQHISVASIDKYKAVSRLVEISGGDLKKVGDMLGLEIVSVARAVGEYKKSLEEKDPEVKKALSKVSHRRQLEVRRLLNTEFIKNNPEQREKLLKYQDRIPLDHLAVLLANINIGDTNIDFQKIAGESKKRSRSQRNIAFQVDTKIEKDFLNTIKPSGFSIHAALREFMIRCGKNPQKWLDFLEYP